MGIGDHTLLQSICHVSGSDVIGMKYIHRPSELAEINFITNSEAKLFVCEQFCLAFLQILQIQRALILALN